MKKWAAIIAVVLAIPLIPFAIIGELPGESWIENPSHTYVFFVGALVMASDIVLPIPSSIIAVSLGAQLGFFWGAIANMAGLSLGSTAGFLAGRHLGMPVLSRILPSKGVDAIPSQPPLPGYLALAMFRAVPILAEASVIAAGVSGMRARGAMVTLLITNAGISLIYAVLGSYGAEYSSPTLIVIGAIGVPVAGILVSRLVNPHTSH